MPKRLSTWKRNFEKPTAAQLNIAIPTLTIIKIIITIINYYHYYCSKQLPYSYQRTT
jgi:hypothetical protein